MSQVEEDLSPIPVSSRPGWFIQPWTLDEAIEHDQKIAEFAKAKDGKGKIKYILAHSLVDAGGVRLFEPGTLGVARGSLFSAIILECLRAQGLGGLEAEKKD